MNMRLSVFKLTLILAVTALVGVACDPNDVLDDENKQENTPEVNNLPDGLEAVDLGLSVKWASFNLGATSPQGFGDYYAWGETEPYYEPGYAQEVPQEHWKEGKTAGYDWPSYKYCVPSDSSFLFTKYCSSPSMGYSGYTDDLVTLETNDDVAQTVWGNGWRMPTEKEFQELRCFCTWTWTTIGGVSGYKVSSNKTGYEDRYIFLPAAGCRYLTDLNNVGRCGFFWSSSFFRYSTEDPQIAWGLFFDSISVNTVNTSEGFRSLGAAVRPVCESDTWEGIKLALDRDSVTINLFLDSVCDPLAVSFMNGNINYYNPECGFITSADYRELSWSSSDESVATVSTDDYHYKCVVKAKAPGKATITATYRDLSASCEVVVISEPTVITLGAELNADGKVVLKGVIKNKGEIFKDYRDPYYDYGIAVSTDDTFQSWEYSLHPDRETEDMQNDTIICIMPEFEYGKTYYYQAWYEVKWPSYLGEVKSFKFDWDGPDVVDLGLSVKWSAFNVGASYPWEYGDYFAWGETEPKTEYSWSTYKYCNGTSRTLTKYNSNSDLGTVDNKTVLDSEDDAAHVILGGSWRTPTKEEFEELMDTCNCTWIRTSLSLVQGYLVKSKVPGYEGASIFLPCAGDDNFVGETGSYWTNMIGKDPKSVWVLRFVTSPSLYDHFSRYYGFTVRPVCPK